MGSYCRQIKALAAILSFYCPGVYRNESGVLRDGGSAGVGVSGQRPWVSGFLESVTLYWSSAYFRRSS